MFVRRSRGQPDNSSPLSHDRAGHQEANAGNDLRRDAGVVSHAVLTGSSWGEQRKYRGANTDEHVRAQARWFVVAALSRPTTPPKRAAKMLRNRIGP